MNWLMRSGIGDATCLPASWRRPLRESSHLRSATDPRSNDPTDNAPSNPRSARQECRQAISPPVLTSLLSWEPRLLWGSARYGHQKSAGPAASLQAGARSALAANDCAGVMREPSSALKSISVAHTLPAQNRPGDSQNAGNRSRRRSGTAACSCCRSSHSRQSVWWVPYECQANQ